MNSLLKAAFARMIKNSYFIIFFIAMPLTNIYMGAVSRKQIVRAYGEYIPVNILFNHTIFMGFAIAIFVGLFIGSEYSDGTIRNKLICGNRRTTVYLSYFITCLTGIVIVHTVSVLAGLGFGRAFIGTFTISASELIKNMVYSSMALANVTALSLMIVTISQNKAVGSAVANCVATAGMISGSMIISMYLEGKTVENICVNCIPDVCLEKIRMYERFGELKMPLECIVACVILLLVGNVLFNRKGIK